MIFLSEWMCFGYLLGEGDMARRTRLGAILFLACIAVAGGCATQGDTAQRDRFRQGAIAYRNHDYVTAAQIYRPLAEQGYADAQNNLGVMYRRGEGVTQDYGEAMKWLRLAAAQDDTDAQFNIGLIYDNGWGVPRDYAEAMKWYRLSADKGDADSQSNVGAMYAGAQGVARDYVEAYKWDTLAANQGNAMAQKNRAELIPQMTPGQIAEARRQAAEFKPKPRMD